MESQSKTTSKKTSTDLLSDWFIFYTAPRAEKVVHDELLRRNYKVFLPTTRTLHKWRNGQKKWINNVLFPSYIFVQTKERELYNIVQTPKVTCYLHIAGKPSIVPLKDIESIKKMLSLNQEISVDNNYKKGERVKIVCGPLAGHEGILVKQKGKTRFGIDLQQINQSIFIDVCTSVLERVN